MHKLMKTGVTLSTAALLATGVAVGGALADGGPSNLNAPGAEVASAPKVLAKTSKPKPRVTAVVKADGTKHRGRGFVSSSKLNAGTYEVFFDRNIKQCAWTGTVGIGEFSGSTGPAMITITGRVGTDNGLFVTTFDKDGVPADQPFLVSVICK
ncbi:MAG TPA: hypothetical protein VFG72_06090 [Marmoricola sp.]|nr:hypothetical protein [Marmoricola sp.]